MARTLGYMIEVMQAARDGKPIQFKMRHDTNWTPNKPGEGATGLCWSWADTDYRIAPQVCESRKAREWWLTPVGPCEQAILVREVLPDEASPSK